MTGDERSDDRERRLGMIEREEALRITGRKR
jgi:hypothetical protein